MVRRPAPVDTLKSGARARPASTAAWARHRMPLPLISASLPSALYRIIDRSAPSRAGPTTIRPSAPTPRWRSHRRDATAASLSSPWGSSTTRKPFPAASCLVRAGGATATVAHPAPLARALDREAPDPVGDVHVDAGHRTLERS